MVHRSILCSFTVALCAACGSDFSASGQALEGGAGAQQDAAHEASAGAAGAGSGGTSAAGAAGVSGAATGGQGGDAGSQAGNGGASGSGAGGSAVDAGFACSPDQVTLLGALPTVIAWPTWTWNWDGSCIECASSPCATSLPFDLQPGAPTWDGSELLIPAGIVSDAYVSLRAGPCGSETDCSIRPTIFTGGIFVKIAPTATGWRITSVRPWGDATMGTPNACYSLMPAGTLASLTSSLTDALNTALVGLVLPCP